MTSVSMMNEVVSDIMGVDRTIASQYSRQLLNSGLLPKSRGRAVASVTPKHVLRLIVAIGLGTKYHEAPDAVSKYLSLRLDGMPPTAPDYMRGTVETRLLYSFMMVIAPQELIPEGLIAHRLAERNLRYEFLISWPQVFVHDPESSPESYKESGKLPGHLEGCFYRSFTLSCYLFDEFCDWDFGFTPEFWADCFKNLEGKA